MSFGTFSAEKKPERMMELFHIMFRMNAETPEVTAVKAVLASTANQLLQFGMRIWTERVITMNQVRISVIQRERSIEAKSVIRQEDRICSVMSSDDD